MVDLGVLSSSSIRVLWNTTILVRTRTRGSEIFSGKYSVRLYSVHVPATVANAYGGQLDRSLDTCADRNDHLQITSVTGDCRFRYC